MYSENSQPPTEFIVKYGNISPGDRLEPLYVLRANSGQELLEMVYDKMASDLKRTKYMDQNILTIKNNIKNTSKLVLWSAPLGTCNRIRIDTMTHFTKRLYDVWIYHSNHPSIYDSSPSSHSSS